MTDYLAGGAEFMYPHAGDLPAPENVKLLLLTRGGICTTGLWHRDWCLGWLALAQPEQEPVKLRRGDILRCMETDKLCTVWATSTTGKTLIKWGSNDFTNYTAEQIGELFWLEEKNT